MNDFAAGVLCAESGKTYLFSVGQAGFIIKSASGQLLGIDLYLSDCVERIEGHAGFKRLLPKILFPMELVFDGIITTHSHFDHFDLDSIPELMSNKKTQLYASRDCAREVDRLYMTDERIDYVKSGDLCKKGDYTLKFVACDHGNAVPEAVGVVINVDSKNIYVAGDTCLRLDRVETLIQQNSIDVMVAPINGAYGNMDEGECAELSKALRPKLTIPCHYGMFASHGGNVGLFMEKMQKVCPENEYLIMALGEKVAL